MRDDLEKLDAEISREVEKAMGTEDTHGSILQEAVGAGRKRIRRTGRFWQRDLLREFDAFQDGPDEYKIVNELIYAAAHDKGAEFDSPPPPENLLPWVRDHMFAFDNYEDPRRAAGALSQELYEDGLDGIFFTETIIRYLEHEAPRKLERYLNQHVSDP